MRRSTLWMCALLVTTTFGCEQVKKQAATVGATVKDQIEKVRERFFHKKPPPPPPAPVAAVPTPPPPAPAPAPHGPLHPAPTERVPPIPGDGPRPRRDIPYVSQDTGTVFPGMTERDVYSLWGAPVAVRHLGEYTYLYFQNGCEYSCGILDVVTLQNGQVVDAIVRWPGHGYGGLSRSNTGGTPNAPPGGDILQMPDTMQPAPTTP
jgi:hypothetical protein